MAAAFRAVSATRLEWSSVPSLPGCSEKSTPHLAGPALVEANAAAQLVAKAEGATAAARLEGLPRSLVDARRHGATATFYAEAGLHLHVPCSAHEIG